MQNINFTELDFEKIILQTELCLERFKSKNVIDHFKNKIPKKYYFI